MLALKMMMLLVLMEMKLLLTLLLKMKKRLLKRHTTMKTHRISLKVI